MNATLPLNRVGAHFDSASAHKLALPQGERARGQLWSDAVFEAVQALRIQLHSRSEPIAAAAANSILELERTRMRHDKCLAGSRNLNEAQEEFERNPTCVEDDDDDADDIDDETEDAVPSADSTHESGRVEEDDCEHHAREMRNFFGRMNFGPWTVERSIEYVVDKLREWKLPARLVPRGEFVGELRSRGELPEPIRAG